MQHLRGHGFLGGLPAATVDEVDGRLRILNEPSQAKVMVFERGTGVLVASTRSRADGTWRVDGISPGKFYTVVGTDDQARVNGSIQDWVSGKPYEA